MHFDLQIEADKENIGGNNADDENADPADGSTDLQ